MIGEKLQPSTFNLQPSTFRLLQVNIIQLKFVVQSFAVNIK